jgi:hypothetical protein
VVLHVQVTVQLNHPTVSARSVKRPKTRSEKGARSSERSIYVKRLLQLYYHLGYPLQFPEVAQKNLPQAYRDRGVDIGDVGYISPANGRFRFLFNILEHANQGVNLNVPERFQPLALDTAREIEVFDPHQANTSLCSPSMEISINGVTP